MRTTARRLNMVRHRWRRATLAMALTAGLAVMAIPGTARADFPCLNPPDDSYELRFDNPVFNPDTQRYEYFRFPDGHTHKHVLIHFYIHQVTPTFNVAAQAFVENRTDATTMGTFTASQSQTFSITQTASATIQSTLMQTVFSSTVSQSVTRSITTSTSIQANAPIPPHSRVNGDFGVDAYNVTYDVAYWQLDDGRCWWHDHVFNVVSNVPTDRQGWVLSPATPI